MSVLAQTPVSGIQTFASPTDSLFSLDGAETVRYAPVSHHHLSPLAPLSRHLSLHFQAHAQYLQPHSVHLESHILRHQSNILRHEPTMSDTASDNDCSSWDERRVGEWLRSISCGQYADAFKGESHSQC